MSKSDRRLWLKLLAAAPLAVALPARADKLADIRQSGRLRIAVYSDFAPYSMSGGNGIDADIGRAIAEKMGLHPEVVAYTADEDMNDDLRNMVWKGHYLGTKPADVMMHVPVDKYLAKANDKVRIFGGYHKETLAIARNPQRVPDRSGSAAVALEVFTREKVGVEIDSLADSFLLSVMNGRLRDNVVHFMTVDEAAKALKKGEISAVVAPRSEVEYALHDETRFPIDAAKFAELRIDGWLLGMAVKVEEEPLADAITTALGELERDGTIAAIFKRYGVSHQTI